MEKPLSDCEPCMHGYWVSWMNVKLENYYFSQLKIEEIMSLCYFHFKLSFCVIITLYGSKNSFFFFQVLWYRHLIILMIIVACTDAHNNTYMLTLVNSNWPSLVVDSSYLYNISFARHSWVLCILFSNFCLWINFSNPRTLLSLNGLETLDTKNVYFSWLVQTRRWNPITETKRDELLKKTSLPFPMLLLHVAQHNSPAHGTSTFAA